MNDIDKVLDQLDYLCVQRDFSNCPTERDQLTYRINQLRRKLEAAKRRFEK